MIKAQRGTKDTIFEQMLQFDKIQKAGEEVFTSSNYSKIQTPIFEATELFARGVGDSTDIVNKEMYTFSINGKESLTLRPENTAGVVRAYIEHGINRTPAPQKFWYFGPMFRYERPQAGRQRQFHQMGAEVFGSDSPYTDVEVISSAIEILRKLGLNDLEVEINSLGCSKCRDNFKTSIKKVLEKYLPELCPDCNMRYVKNPLRMLDCKSPECQAIFEKEEVREVILSDFICDECKVQFDIIKKELTNIGVKYSVNKLLVRGLDYYNRLVFEIKSNNLGSQNAVAGGGRYDGLVSMLGGVETPAVGFAMGVERLASLMEIPQKPLLDYFVVSKDTAAALKLANELRALGMSADFDPFGKKFNKQLERAGKCAKHAIILGEDEINQGFLTVKNLETGEQFQVNSIEKPC